MKVSIVIPNYNGAKLLENNLPEVLKRADNCEIIVVDDASTDNSLQILERYFPQVGVVKLDKNRGFASAVNEGVNRAEEDFVFLLNSDAVPQNNFLNPLLAHFKDSKVFAVGCLQENAQGRSKKKYGRGVGKFRKGFLVHGPGELNRKNTLWVFGGAGMFRKKIWKKLGGMDTLYNPFYWEDIDLSYRALKAGFKLVFEPTSLVNHLQEKGTIKSFYSQEYIKTISYRNQILFVWLNITSIIFLLEHFIFLPFYLLKAVIAQDAEFIRGFVAAFQKLPDVMSRRKRNNKLVKTTDEEVLKEVEN